MDSKKFTYRGESFMKPDNISSNLAKRVVDECGKDYCITVQAVLNLLSKLRPSHNLEREEVEQEFRELNVYLNDIYRQHANEVKDAGHLWMEFSDKFAAFRKKVLSNI